MKRSRYATMTTHLDLTGSKVLIETDWVMLPKDAQRLAAQLLERASDALNARKLARAKRRKS